ncbi:MAG: hypothetical protein RIS94_2149 [Pseudomonadota bacterium]
MATQQMTHPHSDESPDYSLLEPEDTAASIATARGLILGLALSQVFWLVVAWVLFY